MQVHEKQISQPQLFLALAFIEFKQFFTVAIVTCTFSLWHLSVKDYAETVYLALMVGFTYFCFQFEEQSVSLLNKKHKSPKKTDEEENVKSLGVINQFFEHKDIHTRSLLLRVSLTLRTYINLAIYGFIVLYHAVGTWMNSERLPHLNWVVNNVFCFGVFAFLCLFAHEKMRMNCLAEGEGEDGEEEKQKRS